MKQRIALTLLTLFALTAHAAKDMCETGLKQSPIDINEVEAAALPPLSFISQPVDNVVHVKPYNYLFVPQSEVVLKRGETRHKLLQFHMHNPAEHRIKDYLFPLEIHFVFEDGPEKLMVIAQFVNKGPNNALMDSLLYNIALASNEVGASKVHFEMDPTQLMSLDLQYYQYPGSLTTPPCGENVTWLVLSNPIPFAGSQIKDFNRINGLNSRIPQPLNGRTVYASP